MAGSKKDGRGYRGTYYVTAEDGSVQRRKTATCPTKRGALIAARDEEAKVREGSWFDPLPGRMTVAECFEGFWLANRGGELTTRNTYRAHWNAPKRGIRARFGRLELRQIRTSHVQGWVARMRADGLSATTIEGRFMTSKRSSQPRGAASALRDGLIKVNPCHGVEIPRRVTKPVKIYSLEEVGPLLDALDPW
ncbi:hypothetical protein GCM10023340_34310 [Nocardioides marinquilinus]|uniref:Site-specific integrase n=1 Tax=Nocardioides marinquilinus TaxID=1210400 RepID=A0ABP9PVS2_9ACTN